MNLAKWITFILIAMYSSILTISWIIMNVIFLIVGVSNVNWIMGNVLLFYMAIPLLSGSIVLGINWIAENWNN